MSPSQSPIAIARQLDAYGFNILPVRVGDKAPAVNSWRKWSVERSSRMLTSWFTQHGESNYWMATGGVSGVNVLDIDSDAAERWWRDVVGASDLLDATVSSRSAKGRHYFFSVPVDSRTKGWSYHSDGVDFDFRATGQGVILPPSVHASGVIYEWVRQPDLSIEGLGMQPMPTWMASLAATLEHAKATPPAGDVPGTAPAVPNVETSVTSILSALLRNPPAKGGRNDWLTKVAGHYAKTYHKQPDLYRMHLGMANDSLSEPLPPQEFDKTADSIWESEHANHPERDIANCGWLMSGGDRLLTQVKTGKGEDAVVELVEWADFDLRVRGVVHASDNLGDRVYDCTLTRKNDRAEISTVLPGKLIGQPPKLSAWLAGHGVSIARPDNTWPAFPNDATRLLRYLESQNAPQATMAPALGYSRLVGGFLTMDGVIRPSGLHPFDSVRPDPQLALSSTTRTYYGFEGTQEQARATLAEVCTFHDESVAAVFGGWWAACLLKPQIQARVSLFPVMAIEAASGAGKTNGMFGLLMQLNGALAGPGLMTPAAARDKIASHNNGIVWLDDMDELGRIEELLRVTTSNESMAKKGVDNSSTVQVTLSAPVVVSGEHLGVGTQKALMDRVILLNPPKPDGRSSLKPGREGLPQWDDIVDLTERHPLQGGGLGLSVYAGHLVQLALQLANRALDRLSLYRMESRKLAPDSRQADKLAVVLAGAWLLDRLIADLPDDERGTYERGAWSWAGSADARAGSAGPWDNRLTTEVVPWALREYEWPNKPLNRTPVFVAEDTGLMPPTVWVNTSALADAWADHLRGRVTERTDTRKALLDQIHRCAGGEARKQYFDVTVPGRSTRVQRMFWALDDEVAAVVLDRSRQ